MDELYVVARRVLLDALEALGAHRPAVIVVGSHAIYLRVGQADLAIAPHTTDGDLAIEPSLLAESPPLEGALMRAGFLPKARDSVGVWVTHRPTTNNPHTEVSIDLLVSASASPGKGRRAARLPGHDSHAARIVKGLDGVVMDSDIMPVASLDPSDGRSFDMRVAGPAAMLVAKMHKIQDRSGTRRSTDKDALDVLRILRGTTARNLALRMGLLLKDDRAGPAAKEAMELFRQQFANRVGDGIEMVVRAVGSLVDPEEISASCVALANDMLSEVGNLGSSTNE